MVKKPKYVLKFERYRRATGAYGNLDREIRRYAYEYSDTSKPRLLYLKLKKYYRKSK